MEGSGSVIWDAADEKEKEAEVMVKREIIPSGDDLKPKPKEKEEPMKIIFPPRCRERKNMEGQIIFPPRRRERKNMEAVGSATKSIPSVILTSNAAGEILVFKEDYDTKSKEDEKEVVVAKKHRPLLNIPKGYKQIIFDPSSPSFLNAVPDEGQRIPPGFKRIFTKKWGKGERIICRINRAGEILLYKQDDVLQVSAQDLQLKERVVEPKVFSYDEDQELIKEVEAKNNIADKNYEEYKALLESQGRKIDFYLSPPDCPFTEPYKRVNLLLETDEVQRRGCALSGLSVRCMEQDKQFLELYKLAEKNKDKFNICAPGSFDDDYRTMIELVEPKRFNLMTPRHFQGCVNILCLTEFYRLTMPEGRDLLAYLMNNDYKKDYSGDETSFRVVLGNKFPSISERCSCCFTKDMIELAKAGKTLDEGSAKDWIAEHTRIHLDKELPIYEYEYLSRIVDGASKLGIDKMKSRVRPGKFWS